MKLQHFLVIAWLSVVCAIPVEATADNLAMPQEVTEADIKENLPQPYIVKKGDTLWDIADYFFKEPMKWLKIWERNLYISNPDLIYPGNEIWFDAQQKRSGGLTQVRPQPAVVVKPVERLEPKIDMSQLISALARQDLIEPDEIDGVGYILDSQDERLNFGEQDKLYLKLNQPAEEGDYFDVFRTGEPIEDPDTGDVVGVLVQHLGVIEAGTESGGVYRGMVTKTFEELSRGDRLKPAKVINETITPDYPGGELSGKVLYIRNDVTEAGQNQIVGISLGIGDGMKQGTMLSIHSAGRQVKDVVEGGKVKLPEEKIGELMVLVPQKDASMALVVNSTAAINIGDAIRNQADQ